MILLIIAILIIDQWLKIHIKTNFSYGTGVDILGLSWAKLHFVENEGMAFGLSFGGTIGKIILSLFRIVMVFFLCYVVKRLIDAKESLGLILSFGCIIAGALGNIIDSTFYGLLFSSSPYHGGLAEFMPEGGGYAPLLQGKVVDMLYFPLIDSTWPDWFPGWGGQRFQFFKPVFNIADAAISTGVISILLFYRRLFKQETTSSAKTDLVLTHDKLQINEVKKIDEEE